MQESNKCNLFIVGAMKAGTTSICSLLAQHSSIYFSPIKEPNYFLNSLPEHIYKPSRFFNIDNYFTKQFPNPLHIAIVKQENHYNKLFEKATSKHIYRAEGSTAYLHAPESAALIHNYNPNAKILVIIRDPLKRAFSHYKMDLGLAKTTLSFKSVIDNDIITLQEHKLDNWSYLGMSLYYENIKRYKTLFGDNVYVLNFDDFIKKQDAELDKLYAFLKIPRESITMEHKNATSHIKHQKLLYLLKSMGFKDLFSYLVPTKVKHAIFKSLVKKEPVPMDLDANQLLTLKKQFDEDGKKLKTLMA